MKQLKLEATENFRSDVEFITETIANIDIIVKDEINKNPKHIPTFFLIGESNSAGVIPLSYATNDELIVNNNVRILNNHSLSLEPLRIGINNQIGTNSVNTFGFDLILLNAFKQGNINNSKTEIIICNVAFAGANITTLHSKFQDASLKIKATLSGIRAEGNIPIPFVIYSQGINDSVNPNVTLWISDTLRYFKKIRSVIGYAPIFITELIHTGIVFNDAIRFIASTDINCYVIAKDNASLYEVHHWDKTGLSLLFNRALAYINEIGFDSNYFQHNNKALIKTMMFYLDDRDNILAKGGFIGGGDNNAISLGGQYMGLVKKAGYPEQIVVVEGQPILFSRINKAKIEHSNIEDSTISQLGRFSESGAFLVGVVGNESLSAIAEFASSTRGFLMPRMTTVQRNAIVSPAEGLEIYNLSTHAKEFFNGTIWKIVQTA